MISSVHDTGFATWRVTLIGGTILFVPKDPNNADYVRVQAWVAAGGVIA
jgi:hypothetical protein